MHNREPINFSAVEDDDPTPNEGEGEEEVEQMGDREESKFQVMKDDFEEATLRNLFSKKW
jgi:hypothetical protein